MMVMMTVTLTVTPTTAIVLTTALQPLTKTHVVTWTDPIRARDCVKGDGLE